MATNLPMLQFEPFIMEDGKKLNLGIRVKGKQDYSCRPQVSRQIPIVGLKWVGRCCLSIVKLGHAYPMVRLSVHHLLRDCRRKLSMKRNSFLSNHWPLFYPRTNQITAWSFRDPKSFLSHPLSTLHFEECRSAIIISAILT